MKSFNLRKIILILLFLSNSLFAEATFTSGSTAAQLAAQIKGTGVTITNPIITFGDSTQVGIFSNGIGGANLQIDAGITLTTMTVNESFTTNNSNGFSTSHAGSYSDPDLIAIDGSARFNTIVYEFDITLDPNTRLLLLDYQFAAEEYNEYVGTIYNDAFGFFISGGDLNQTYNIARVVNNQTYVNVNNIGNFDTVTVNNVNDGNQGSMYNPSRDGALTPVYTNTAFYIDNTIAMGSPVIVEYDGLTIPLHATLDNLTPGVTYHFKMAIADTSDANLNTGVFINKINGLREPNLCYDYAYKQNGHWLTKEHNSTTGPAIDTDVIDNNLNYPVEVAMYIKNLSDSEIVASNVRFDVFDINTTQATYAPESVWVTETGELYPTKINDIDLNISTGYVQDIPITSFDSNEYFYTYFSLNPKVTHLHMPINARITYDLTIPLSATQTQTITRTSLIDDEIQMCSDSSVYKPAPGIFSVVHNDYYNLDVKPAPSILRQFYNIPTQVASREGNFKVISLDVNNTDQLEARSTMVAVEMVDISAFHDTNASCNQQSNAITPRVWIMVGDYTNGEETSAMFNQAALQTSISKGMTTINNGTQLLTNASDFYQNVRENAAFRISYNKTLDGNNSLVKITPNPAVINNYSINFTELVQTVSKCAQDMDGNTANVDTVATYCGNSSNKLTEEDIALCMECLYGYNTEFVCSRDNFAIRPEAFLMHIDDQNQTVPTTQSRLTTNYSGVASPTNPLPVINIAAGYEYNIEVNATNHLNTNASPGYIKKFDSVSTDADRAEYTWEPRGLTAAQLITKNLACNDDSNKSAVMQFMNGVVDTNTSVDQVGEYELNIIDTTWTSVDSNPSQMTHHTGNYFLSTNTPDCTLDSNRTYPVNTPINLTNATMLANSLTGCNITSDHTGSSASGLIYNDYDVEFHPYKFAVNNNLTISITNITPPIIKPFVYMANIDLDENMSVHLNTDITAVGQNNVQLTNFVTACYSEPLNILIDKSDINSTTIAYKYKFHNLDSNGSVITGHDINATIAEGNVTEDPKISTLNTFFQKDKNGTISTITNLNFHRDINKTANPEDINYTTYNVDDNATLFNADLVNNKIAEGNLTINQNIIHYFGRTAAKKTTVRCTNNASSCVSGTQNDDVFIYYEIFCNGTSCDTTLLPYDSSSSPIQRTHKHWFTNLNHLTTNYGGITNITEQPNNIAVGAISYPSSYPDNNYTLTEVHTYDMSGTPKLPYLGNMQDSVPNWLIYDENNGSATFNTHQILFVPTTMWTGEHEADSTTKTDRVIRVNRRTMW